MQLVDFYLHKFVHIWWSKSEIQRQFIIRSLNPSIPRYRNHEHETWEVLSKVEKQHCSQSHIGFANQERTLRENI